MEDLVSIINNRAVCTSLQVAEKFNKRHDHVLRDIDAIISESPDLGSEMFTEKTYKNTRGKTYRCFEMNRDGFSLLAMGFTGKEALQWKIKYINAFNKMEDALKEKNSKSWTTARQQGKLIRKAETDVIKKLVEYAKEQGSTHADMLYMAYSKLANRICGVSDRDNATAGQLTNLTVAENIILHCVRIGLEQQKHYKDIYQDCKNRLEEFSRISYLV